jgi:hypothetical protein
MAGDAKKAQTCLPNTRDCHCSSLVLFHVEEAMYNRLLALEAERCVVIRPATRKRRFLIRGVQRKSLDPCRDFPHGYPEGATAAKSDRARKSLPIVSPHSGENDLDEEEEEATGKQTTARSIHGRNGTAVQPIRSQPKPTQRGASARAGSLPCHPRRSRLAACLLACLPARSLRSLPRAICCRGLPSLFSPPVLPSPPLIPCSRSPGKYDATSSAPGPTPANRPRLRELQAPQAKGLPSCQARHVASLAAPADRCTVQRAHSVQHLQQTSLRVHLQRARDVVSRRAALQETLLRRGAQPARPAHALRLPHSLRLLFAPDARVPGIPGALSAFRRVQCSARAVGRLWSPAVHRGVSRPLQAVAFAVPAQLWLPQIQVGRPDKVFLVHCDRPERKRGRGGCLRPGAHASRCHRPALFVSASPPLLGLTSRSVHWRFRHPLVPSTSADDGGAGCRTLSVYRRSPTAHDYREHLHIVVYRQIKHASSRPKNRRHSGRVVFRQR